MEGRDVCKAAERVRDSLATTVLKELLVRVLRARVLVQYDRADHLVCVRDDLGHASSRTRGVEERCVVVQTDGRLRVHGESQHIRSLGGWNSGEELCVLECVEDRNGNGAVLGDLRLEGLVDDDCLATTLHEELDDDGESAKVAAEELGRVSQRRDGDGVD